MSKEIEQAVEAELAKAGVQYSAALVGETKRGDWVCDEWTITFSAGKFTVTFPYYTGTGHRVDTTLSKRIRANLKNVSHASAAWRNGVLANMVPSKPHPASVIYSTIQDAQANTMSFDDWCADFGYSTDSRKALETYLYCQETDGKMRRALGASYSSIAKLLEDY